MLLRIALPCAWLGIGYFYRAGWTGDVSHSKSATPIQKSRDFLDQHVTIHCREIVD